MRFNDLADIGDDDLGALGLRRRKRVRGGVPARRLIPKIAGVPARGLREQPLPLGTTTFTNTSGTSLTLTAKPQRPFRGRRLILSQARSAGAGAILVNVTSITVGADNQLPVGQSSMPADAYGPTAVGTNLDMDPATPGVDVEVGLAVTAAPAAGEFVTVSGVIIGQAAA